MSKLIQNLMHSSCYPHPVSGLKLISTHSAHIILTGKFAYKIKQEVDLGFLDFSTLEKRKCFCEIELKLNNRTAPDIYLEVVPITGSINEPKISGNGKIIEYAVKMIQFDNSKLLDQIEGGINEKIIKDLWLKVSKFHNFAEKCSNPFGTPEKIFFPMNQNFEQLQDLPVPESLKSKIELLKNWSFLTHENLIPLFNKRIEQGFIRDCHGDLHLGNVVLFNNEITLFDALDFSSSLRKIDIICDISMLILDLSLRNFNPLIYLEKYFQSVNDSEGIQLIPYYVVYRAMVRAKVVKI